MRKINGNKEYVQLKDIVFMKYMEMDDIPNSLMKRFFEYTKTHTLFIEREEEYLDLKTKEEIDFIKSKKFIMNKNYLDMLDNNKLKEELMLIKKSVEKQKDKFIYSVYNEQNEIDYIILQYQYNSFVDYLNDRIEVSCENCDNFCYKPESLKTGLDRDGKPVGNDCFRFTNELVKIKKYKYRFKDFNI